MDLAAVQVLLPRGKHVIHGSARPKDFGQGYFRAAFKARVETLRSVREKKQRSVWHRVGNIYLPEGKKASEGPAEAVRPIDQHRASRKPTAHIRHWDPGRYARLVVEDTTGKTEEESKGWIANAVIGNSGLLRCSRTARACWGRRDKVERYVCIDADVPVELVPEAEAELEYVATAVGAPAEIYIRQQPAFFLL